MTADETMVAHGDGANSDGANSDGTEEGGVRAAHPLAAADRAQIDDLLSSYVLSLDVHDIDTAVALFTEDGEFRTYGRAWVGPARLRRFFESAPRGLHLAGRALITPNADGATVRQQLVFYPADRSPHRLSIYDDILVRADGRWLFRSRECRFMNDQGVLATHP